MAEFMTTGYTKFIEDGSIDNAKDFLKLCLRNFGIMQQYRDEPLGIIENPDFEQYLSDSMDDYRKDMLIKANNEIQKINDFPIKDYAIQKLAEYQDYLDEETAKLNNAIKFMDKLEKIENDIKAWNAEDDFLNIKTFAIEQINTTKESICIKLYKKNIKEYEEIVNGLSNPETKLTVAQRLKDDEIAYQNRQIGYLEEKIKSNVQEKIEESKSKLKEFYDRFIKSIENI